MRPNRSSSYPSYHLLRALTYFADAEDDESPRMLVPYDWTQVKHFFKSQVKTLIQEL